MGGSYTGPWGNFGGPVQKGVTTYSLSPNRQRPLAGTANAAVFNVWRRFISQAPYFIPPIIIGYSAMSWATERNHYLNSKAGRAEAAEIDMMPSDGTVQ